MAKPKAKQKVSKAKLNPEDATSGMRSALRSLTSTIPVPSVILVDVNVCDNVCGCFCAEDYIFSKKTDEVLLKQDTAMSLSPKLAGRRGALAASSSTSKSATRMSQTSTDN